MSDLNVNGPEAAFGAVALLGGATAAAVGAAPVVAVAVAAAGAVALADGVGAINLKAMFGSADAEIVKKYVQQNYSNHQAQGQGQEARR